MLLLSAVVVVKGGGSMVGCRQKSLVRSSRKTFICGSTGTETNFFWECSGGGSLYCSSHYILSCILCLLYS